MGRASVGRSGLTMLTATFVATLMLALGIAVVAGPHPGTATPAPRTLSTASVTPLALTAKVTITSTDQNLTKSSDHWIRLPYLFNFTISYTGVPNSGSSLSSNVWMNVSATDDVTGIGVTSAVAPVAKVYNYTYQLTENTLLSSLPAQTLTAGKWTLKVNLTVRDSANKATPPAYSQASLDDKLILENPTAAFLTPTTTDALSTGSQRSIIAFSGYFIGKVTLNITSGGKTVFPTAAISVAPTPAPQTVIVSWDAKAPGSYTLNLTIYTSYWENDSWWENLSVGASNVVYYNTTTPSGAAVGSLGAGGSGALLVVLGMILGMIVMWFVGRRVWGAQKVSPAQPWTPQAGSQPECSVCHQTFATEAELKDHAKTQHGITG